MPEGLNPPCERPSGKEVEEGNTIPAPAPTPAGQDEREEVEGEGDRCRDRSLPRRAGRRLFSMPMKVAGMERRYEEGERTRSGWEGGAAVGRGRIRPRPGRPTFMIVSRRRKLALTASYQRGRFPSVRYEPTQAQPIHHHRSRTGRVEVAVRA